MSFKEASRLQVENDAAAAAGIAAEFRAGDRARAARSSAFIRQAIGNIQPAPDFMIAGTTRQYSEAEIAALCRLPSYGTKEWLQTATSQELKAYQNDLSLPRAVAVDADAEARLEYQRQTTRNSLGMTLLAGFPGAALPGQLSRLAGHNEYRVAGANEIGGAFASLEMSFAGMPARGSISISPEINWKMGPVPTIREGVLENLGYSQAARSRSNFDQFYKVEGKLQADLMIWPPNSGGYSPSYNVTLDVGAKLDRYGYPGGAFVSPQGTSFAERALPASFETGKPYFQYEVTQPIGNVTQAKALPWFGQPGKGTQFQLAKPVEWYLDHGFLKVK